MPDRARENQPTIGGRPVPTVLADAVDRFLAVLLGPRTASHDEPGRVEHRQVEE